LRSAEGGHGCIRRGSRFRKAEIERLEGAILSRQATREAAAAAFKG
jgi:hypothetical protein